MKAFILYIQLILCCPLLVAAQSTDCCNWMSRLDDARTVASLSIPGAHDAATGEGLLMVAGLGKTQELTLAGQWECGVRAFDLRPAVNGKELHIYHGPAKTRITFQEALETLCSMLEQHPTEFAIVLLREENDSENAAERALWPTAVGEAIASFGEKAATFSPSISVGEARGKIIFLSRNAYTGCDRGAIITGWSHSQGGTINAKITSCADGRTASLMVQDFYAPTGKERQQAKKEGVLRFLGLAAETSGDTWTINSVSGYRNRWLGFTPFATTAGYKRNAVAQHPVVIEFLEKNSGPTGIVMMDYAGRDKASGGIWHWSAFETMGAALVKKIIEQNFR